MLELAEHILDSKVSTFDPGEFRDRYEEALVALLKSQQAGVLPRQGKQVMTAPQNVINLMDALRRSIETAETLKNKAQARKPPAPSTAKRNGGRRKSA